MEMISPIHHQKPARVKSYSRDFVERLIGGDISQSRDVVEWDVFSSRHTDEPSWSPPRAESRFRACDGPEISHSDYSHDSPDPPKQSGDVPRCTPAASQSGESRRTQSIGHQYHLPTSDCLPGLDRCPAPPPVWAPLPCARRDPVPIRPVVINLASMLKF
jgi:hypothetical protein